MLRGILGKKEGKEKERKREIDDVLLTRLEGKKRSRAWFQDKKTKMERCGVNTKREVL